VASGLEQRGGAEHGQRAVPPQHLCQLVGTEPLFLFHTAGFDGNVGDPAKARTVDLVGPRPAWKCRHDVEREIGWQQALQRRYEAIAKGAQHHERIAATDTRFGHALGGGEPRGQCAAVNPSASHLYQVVSPADECEATVLALFDAILGTVPESASVRLERLSIERWVGVPWTDHWAGHQQLTDGCL
jgi:hypothetical protein